MLNVPERIKLRRIQHRSDTSSEWVRINPILLDGEFGVERETGLFKIGDGVKRWVDLVYGGVNNDIAAQISPATGNKLTLINGKLYVPDDAVVDYVNIYNIAKS